MKITKVEIRSEDGRKAQRNAMIMADYKQNKVSFLIDGLQYFFDFDEVSKEIQHGWEEYFEEME